MPTIHCYFENKAAAACATSALNKFCSICTAFRCLHRIWDRSGFALENTEAFFKFNYANREWFLLAYEAGLSQTLLSAFDAIFVEQPEAKEHLYANAFFKYGLFGILNAWILNGFKETPEEMIKIGEKIISSIVYDATQN